MYNIVLLCPDDLPADVARQAGSIDEMRKLFTKWDPILNRFLDNVKSVDKWKLMHRPELDSWISDKSTFVFIGDSKSFALSVHKESPFRRLAELVR